MQNKNFFLLLSLLSIPTNHLYAAAESIERRLRREALEDMYRGLIDQALSTDEADFFCVNRESLDFDNKEKKVTETKEPTSKRGRSIVEMIVSNTVLNKEIAELIEIYEKSNIKEITINPKKGVYSVAIDINNENIIATITAENIFGDANNIYLSDAKTGMWIKTLIGHTSTIMSIAFSPDGNYIASGSCDNNIRIWHVESGQCLHSLKGDNNDNLVESITFSPDSRSIASGFFDNNIHIWDVTTGEYLRKLKKYKSTVGSIAFSPDNQFIASGLRDNTICIWHVATGTCLKILCGHDKQINSVIFSPDGQLIASGSVDKTIRIWNTKTDECLKILQGHDQTVNTVAFSPDGQYVISGSHDKTVRIWHIATGACLKILQGHNGNVCFVAFFLDGQHIMSGSWDNTIRIWNISEILATKN